jgi:hypothetical protein
MRSADGSRAGEAPASYPQGTSSDEIRRDIRRTRAQMDETVDAIEERLRPRHLIDDLLEMFRSSGGGSAVSGASHTFKDAGYKIFDKLKQHPMPAALIGAGLVWLMFERDDDGRALRDYRPRKWDVPPHSGSYVDARTGQPYSADYENATGEQSRGKVGSAIEGAKETVQSAAGKVGEWTGSAWQGAASAGQAMRDYASSTSDGISRGYETGKHYVARGMEEYPLAMGAAAMALGVLTGLILPRTRAEDQLMGDAADEVKDRVREAGQEVVERGKEVAREAGQEAQRQGLGAGTIVEKAKRVIEDVKDAASESAKREGIDPQTLAHKGKEVAERTKESARDQAQRERERFNA